jgi:RNA polymerase sigma-70 factor (ECF subfamily)
VVTGVTDLDRLFREYHQPLVRYLTRRLGDRDWAEEVAQETFLRAVRQEEAIVSERSWLFAVATNLIRDEARRDARRRKHLELLREQARAEEAVEPEPLTIERAQEAAMARRAIEMLSERDREALLMKEEGLDYTEIAAALELSVASVGRHWRARGGAWSKRTNRYRKAPRTKKDEVLMQHLDEGTIHAWLDGALPQLDAEQVAKHAAECASCAAAVAEARGIIAGSARIVSALDDVPGGVIPGRTTRGPTGSSAWGRLRLTPGRAALAATILLAVSTTLTLRSSSSPSIEADSGVTADAIKPATPAAAPLARSVTLDSIKVPAGVGGRQGFGRQRLEQATAEDGDPSRTAGADGRRTARDHGATA